MKPNPNEMVVLVNDDGAFMLADEHKDRSLVAYGDVVDAKQACEIHKGWRPVTLTVAQIAPVLAKLAINESVRHLHYYFMGRCAVFTLTERGIKSGQYRMPRTLL